MHLGGRAKRQDLIERLTTDFEVGERTAIKAIDEAYDMQRIGKKRGGREVEFHTL